MSILARSGVYLPVGTFRRNSSKKLSRKVACRLPVDISETRRTMPGTYPHWPTLSTSHRDRGTTGRNNTALVRFVNADPGAKELDIVSLSHHPETAIKSRLANSATIH